MKPPERLEGHRDAIRAIIQAHHAGNPRVSGSVPDCQDTADSHLNLLVEPEPGMSLFDVGAIRWTLRDLLGVRVDVVSAAALPDPFRDAVIRLAAPI